MAALSGGGRSRDDGRPPLRQMLDRLGVAFSGAAPGLRPLDRILPQPADPARVRALQSTWLAFCAERVGAVRAILSEDRTSPEIAYALGEIVHAFFRIRAVGLTGHELHRLVAELTAVYGPVKKIEMPVPEPVQELAPEPMPEPVPVPAAPEPPGLVSFTGDPAGRAPTWTGEKPPPEPPALPDSVFEAPPSALVQIASREAASLDKRLAEVLVLIGTRRLPHAEATALIDTAIAKVAADRTMSDEDRTHLASAALSEISGLGLIDRLWADRSIRALFINGPGAVHVERNGQLEASTERFRDQAHLLELVSRLVVRPPGDVAEFQLPDGSAGSVIFPPAAPNGPVLALHRREAGSSTFEHLEALGVLNAAMAETLRVATRSGLNILVVGPSGSGKTSLLAAIVRDLDTSARVVTVARDREFRWEVPTKVELVASSETGGASYSALLTAALRLRPQLLVLDALQQADLRGLSTCLAQGARGIVTAVESGAVANSLVRTVDLVVRLGRGPDNVYRAVSVEDSTGAALFTRDGDQFRRSAAAPAFAKIVAAAGQGEALMRALA